MSDNQLPWRNSPPTTEEEIIDTLTTHGRDPLELHFVWRNAIRGWDPESGFFFHHLIEDYQKSRDCLNYMKKRGPCLETWDELAEWARTHNWPSLDKLLLVIEKAKRHEQTG